MSIVAYEGATLAYDDQKGYINPQNNTVYGADPPTGWWRVTMDPKYATSAATGSGTSANVNSPVPSNVTSMQVLSQDQITMALSMGYTQPQNMSSGQLALVNSALANSAARTQAQQAATSGGSTVTTSATSTNAQAQSSGATSAAGATGAGFDLSKFMTDNSTILMIAAAVVVGLMMFGGESHGRGH